MENIKAFLYACILLAILKCGADKQERVEVRNAVDKFLHVMDTMGIRYSSVALAQALHETNIFQSRICKENYNIFGMKESSRHYDIGSQYGHAKYPHDSHKGKCTIECYMHSLRDYKAWQDRMMPWPKIENEQDYIWYLQHLPGGLSYAEDPNYMKRINHYLNLIKR